MTRPRRNRFVFKVYAIIAVLSIAIMVALVLLPRYQRAPRYLEPQAALLQYMVERWSLREGNLHNIMSRIEPRLRGELSLYDDKDALLHTTIDPPLPRVRDGERAGLQQKKWALSYRRIVVRSDNSKLVAVYQPRASGFPWAYVIPMAGAILVVAGVASLWLSRRLAKPLDALADAAHRFGAGDTKARVRLSRQDELGDVGRAFDEMADRTAAMLEAQRQLMADVSHELRTPLARIRVALELAAEDPAAAKELLTEVGSDLDEIDQLIGDILTTARLDGAHAKVQRRPAHVEELAERAAQRFASRHPRRTLDTKVEGDREIECDPMLLRRAIDNLLDNAAKYSEPTEPVRLRVVPDDRTVVFEIVDNGIGMSAEELERAFTPFWRADSSRTRKTGGVGLGLALARRIARAHGGDVLLSSAPGKGTTARLVVECSQPVDPASSAAGAAVVAADAADSAA